MAMVGGFGGGHVTAHYKERRRSIAAKADVENCGCIHFSLKQKPKKKNKSQVKKERRKQFSIWFFETEEQREIEHGKRRQQRKKKKKMQWRGIANRCVLCLYGFDAILWVIGTMFTLCSSVKAFGKHTDFYKSKHLYRLLGPAFLLAALLMLLLATGLKHRMRTKHEKPQRNFYILQKKKKASFKSDTHTKDPDNDSGNEEDIEKDAISKPKLLELKLEEEKENNAIAKTILMSDQVWQDDISIECTALTEQPEIELGENLKRVKDRKAWAKTKWMRLDTEADEDVELDDIVALRITENKEYEEGSIGTVANTQTKVHPKSTGKRRITRFKPMSGSCFTAQSSIKSQTSMTSCTSTTSESAPLVRR